MHLQEDAVRGVVHSFNGRDHPNMPCSGDDRISILNLVETLLDLSPYKMNKALHSFFFLLIQSNLLLT